MLNNVNASSSHTSTLKTTRKQIGTTSLLAQARVITSSFISRACTCNDPFNETIIFNFMDYQGNHFTFDVIIRYDNTNITERLE